MKLADVFTMIRIVAAPIFLVIYFIPEWFGVGNSISVYILIPLILFAEFTDYLDGHYARKTNQVSDFGKLFDPFADVFLHLTVFFCYAKSGYVSPFIVLLFAYREFSMLFLRQIAAKQGIAIAAKKGGKFKTVLYIIAGFYSLFLECCSRLSFDIHSVFPLDRTIGLCLYVLALIASYVSFIDYLVSFTPVIKKDKKD